MTHCATWWSIYASNYTMIYSFYSATGVFTDGKMVICGGGWPSKSVCFSYSDDDQGWIKLADTDVDRYDSSSVPISDGILVTGGNVESDHNLSGNILKTSEIVKLNGTIKPGKSLPRKRDGHCMVEYQG